MTNPDYTHITLVVDRSGSMHTVRDDAEGGVAALLAEQFALDGKLTVTLTEFSDHTTTIARLTDEEFTYQLNPEGNTALLDAVGSEILATGADLAQLPEEDRPGRVLFVIVTDGEENSSSEHTLDEVKAMVEHQADVYSWAFQFIGAGTSAWQGQAMGMNTSSYLPSGEGTQMAYAVASAATTAYRGGAAFAMPAVLDPEDDTA